MIIRLVNYKWSHTKKPTYTHKGGKTEGGGRERRIKKSLPSSNIFLVRG